jgi:ferrous iron transport protein A
MYQPTEFGTSIGDVLVRLGRASKGERGVIARVETDEGDLERRLLEIGFVEGAHIEVLHEGPIGRDPIAVRLDDMRVALRRREADAVLIRLEHVSSNGWLQAAE